MRLDPIIVDPIVVLALAELTGIPLTPHASRLTPVCAGCGVELTEANTAPGCGLTCILCIS